MTPMKENGHRTLTPAAVGLWLLISQACLN